MMIEIGIIVVFLAISHTSSVTVTTVFDYKEFDPKWKTFDQCPKWRRLKSLQVFFK
jgi:hypothetical protein